MVRVTGSTIYRDELSRGRGSCAGVIIREEVFASDAPDLQVCRVSVFERLERYMVERFGGRRGPKKALVRRGCGGAETWCSVHAFVYW